MCSHDARFRVETSARARATAASILQRGSADTNRIVPSTSPLLRERLIFASRLRIVAAADRDNNCIVPARGSEKCDWGVIGIEECVVFLGSRTGKKPCVERANHTPPGDRFRPGKIFRGLAPRRHGRLGLYRQPEDDRSSSCATARVAIPTHERHGWCEDASVLEQI